jgi:hypothetical protein
MEAVPWILKIAGFLALIVGWFSVLREMFMESRGLGYLGFLLPAAIGFALLHWEDLKRQALFMIAGLAMLAGGIGLEKWAVPG